LSKDPFARVVAAIATPFQASGTGVDLELFSAHARWLLGSGCDGLVLFGTTGEAASLALAERKAVLEGLIERGVAPGRLVVGTGCCAVAETVALVVHAAQRGCAGALIVPPFFYKGVSEEGVRRCFDAMIEGCGTDLPPIYLYHIPQVSAVPLGPDLTGALIEAHGERIAGYKDSAGDWTNTAEIIRRFPQLHVYVGSEAQLLATLRAGGAGCISATTNVQPQASGRLAADWRSEAADTIQTGLTTVRKAMERHGQLISSTKAVLAEIHGEPAWRAPRPPLLPLGEAEEAALLAEMSELGLAPLGQSVS